MSGLGLSPGNATETVKIKINNLNDSAPVISREGATYSITEGTINNTINTSYTFTADDPDGGTSDLSLSGDNRFELAPNGRLRIKANSTFDYETETSVTLTITATDTGVGSGSAQANATQDVTININNRNDHSPIISVVNDVQDKLTTGTFQDAKDTGYIFAASDPDGGTSSLSVLGDNQDRFEIVSGVLQIKAGSEFTTPGDITLSIRATDSGVGSGSQPDSAQNVIITISEGTPPLITLPKDSGGNVVEVLGTDGADSAITGTSADEVVQGGNDNDTINIAGGDDVVIGGYGADTITLGAGTETVIYRFDSDSNNHNQWRAEDGADTINNFEGGVDKLVLVDVVDKSGVNAITSFADFAADAGSQLYKSL